MKEKKIFLILFYLSVVFFVLDQRGLLQPIREKIERVANPARAKIYLLAKKPGQVWQSLKVKREVFEEFSQKERELEACRLEAQILKKENQDLRRLLQAPLPKAWAFLPARVLGKRRYLAIDKGESDGAWEGMTVVFENFLVGKVIKTESLSSLVALPFDSESKITVQTQKGVKGLLEGRFGTKIFLTRVLQGEALEVGELVVTSGEEYLPDLLIGKIKSGSRETQAPFQEVEVEPILDYGQLTTVFLVKP